MEYTLFFHAIFVQHSIFRIRSESLRSKKIHVLLRNASRPSDFTLGRHDFPSSCSPPIMTSLSYFQGKKKDTSFFIRLGKKTKTIHKGRYIYMLCKSYKTRSLCTVKGQLGPARTPYWSSTTQAFFCCWNRTCEAASCTPGCPCRRIASSPFSLRVSGHC